MSILSNHPGNDASSASLQVTKGTVDEGIHAMAERKLRLDAAVLDGVTAAGDGKASNANVETAQVLLVIPDSSAHMSRVHRAFRISKVQVPWQHASQRIDASGQSGMVLLGVISCCCCR
jgi:hypothetical protein